MEKQVIIWFALVFIFLTTVVLISSSGLENSVKELPSTHSFTKAFCDSKNFCEDYVVYCNNKNVLNIRATGSVVQFSSDWKDMRSEEMKNRQC